MSYTRITYNAADVVFSAAKTYTRFSPTSNIITFSISTGGINTRPINSEMINGSSITVYGIGEGEIVAFEQMVALIGSGEVITFEQTVDLDELGEGLIISFEQSVTALASGQCITFEQNVMNLTANTFYIRNGYDVEIVVGGYSFPKNQIHGDINIERVTGESASCKFTIIPPAGTQNPEVFQGMPVFINIIKNGTSYREFTGYVDLPSIDLIEKKITFDCTDRRINRINSLSRNIIEQVGSYSTHVFGDSEDNNDELTKRLETVSGDFDFDREGNYQLTPWAPKATPDFTLTGSDIYYDKPEVTYTNRTQTLNTVNFTINYTYQRLHQQAMNIVWPGYATLPSWYNQGLPSFPAREMIESVARQGAWQPITQLTHTALWEAQGFSAGGSTVAWQPNQVEHEYQERTKRIWVSVPGGGSEQIEAPVLDVNGQKIYDVVKTTYTDTSSYLSRGVSWRAGIKFAQNVTEQYNISLKSPQAILRYGTIASNEKIDIVDDYDTSVWENTDTGMYQVDYNFYVNQKSNYPDLGKAFQVMLNKARCNILKAHRDVIVSFTREIWPEIDLKHTVEVSSTPLDCKGKVDRITHIINVGSGQAYTNIELRLSRAQQIDTDEIWEIIIPPIEDESYIGSVGTLSLQTHVGIDPDPLVTVGADSWNGYIGNANRTDTTINNTIMYRTQFSEQFRVDYPEIANYLRDTRILNSDYEFDVKVPNDPLTIGF